MTIDSWLNQAFYSSLIQENTALEDTSAINLVVARSLDEWSDISGRVKPGNQSLHLSTPSLIGGRTLQTVFFGDDPRMVPTINLERESDGAFKGLSIKSLGLDATDRSVLEIISLYSQKRDARKLRMLVAEPFSALSLQVRGRYPFAITSGFMPDGPNLLFPLMHIDLQEIALPDDSMDVLLSVEVFEHLPKYKKALEEARRVLRKGGIYVFTCPFYCNTKETTIKAVLNDEGNIEYLTPPEYHGDPLRPADGILVFQIPGWNILSDIISSGFSDAAVCFISNPCGGIIGRHYTGCFVFVCEK